MTELLPFKGVSILLNSLDGINSKYLELIADLSLAAIGTSCA